MRYLPQEPDFAGYATTLDFVLAGLGDEDDPYRARALMADLGVDREGRPGAAVGRRGAPRGDRPRAGAPSPTSCCSTSRPTISTSSPSNGWRRTLGESRAAFALVSHDRRLLAD